MGGRLAVTGAAGRPPPTIRHPPPTLRSTRLGYAFVLPTLAFLVLFNVFPLVYNLVLGFTNAKLSGGAWQWVGGWNYGRVFSKPEFAAALRTTGAFVACAVAAELALGFVLALALAGRFRGKTV